MLKFKFNSFKVIKSAELELADITVIAGNNATGKSTIAESVAAFVNASAGYRVYATEAFFLQYVFVQFSAFQRFFSKLAEEDQFRELRRPVIDDFFNSKIFQFKSIRGQVLKDFTMGRISYEDILNELEQVVCHAIDVMCQCGTPPIRFLNQLFKELKMGFPNDKMPQADFQNNRLLPSVLYDLVKLIMKEARKTYSEVMSSRAIGYLPGYLQDALLADHVSIEEDGDVLFPVYKSKLASIGVCASLNRAIYLRSPYDTRIHKDEGVWHIGTTVISLDSIDNHDLKLDSYSNFLGGDVLWDDQEQRWVFTEQGNHYDLMKCATGIRAVADIKKLEQLQVLDPGTILILDEPEAHLHPEWIVRYAGLLIHAVKEYGIHLLVATHSPMMMLALHDIAMEEGLKGRYKCYQTEMISESSRQAALKAVDDDISPSFESFNKAYDFIDGYRAMDKK